MDDHLCWTLLLRPPNWLDDRVILSACGIGAFRRIPRSGRRLTGVMTINEFLYRARSGRVRITLTDGQVHTGHFRTDILSVNALSAFFFGEVRPLSLPIHTVVSIEALAADKIAS